MLKPNIIVLMGVSGCGKTTLGKALATRFNSTSPWRFIDADDLHTDDAKSLMANGVALTDKERIPWLQRVCKHSNLEVKRGGVILACSCLKSGYRQLLRNGLSFKPLFIYLEADKVLIKNRLTHRNDHFFPFQLLDSQFDALEVPEGESDVLTLDAQHSCENLVRDILKTIQYE